jgi:hypothetical protein
MAIMKAAVIRTATGPSLGHSWCDGTVTPTARSSQVESLFVNHGLWLKRHADLNFRSTLNEPHPRLVTARMFHWTP